jgi:hypothetical protein
MQHDELDALCDQLMELQVRRKLFIGLANKQTNTAKAAVRRALGWRWDEAEAGRIAVNKKAARIATAALAGKPLKNDDEAVLAAVAPDLAVMAMMVSPGEAHRAQIEKEMVRIAKRLPAHAWQKAVVGLGEKALAIIVGEAGNLSRYDHEDKLKKRLGIAPFNGKAFSRWRAEGGLTAEEWSEAGYSPRRRAEIYAVIEPLFKHQTMSQGPYRAIYDRRRVHTAETHPEWRKIQSHMDGLRVMTQELITDLWSEWRRAFVDVPTSAKRLLPAADHPTTNGSGDEPGLRANPRLPEGATAQVPAAMELA